MLPKRLMQLAVRIKRAGQPGRPISLIWRRRACFQVNLNLRIVELDGLCLSNSQSDRHGDAIGQCTDAAYDTSKAGVCDNDVSTPAFLQSHTDLVHSVEHPDKPVYRSYTRMSLTISGFMAEDDGQGGCTVTQLTDLSALGCELMNM